MLRKNMISLIVAVAFCGTAGHGAYAKVADPTPECLADFDNCYNKAFPGDGCNQLKNIKDKKFCDREYNLCRHDHKAWTEENCRTYSCVETFKHCKER